MGVYVTTTSIAPRMVGTKFDTATTALCSELILDAEAEVHKYISRRYDITALISSPPPIVVAWVKNLTVGYMYRSLGRGGKDAYMRANEIINPVIENMTRVAEYKSEIVDGSGSPFPDMSNTAYAVRSTTSDYNPTFNEDDQKQWKVDRRKLDDIRSERDDD